MIIGIEASNILAGGGLVHLKELLNHANPEVHGFERLIVWAPQSTLVQLPDKSWLEKKSHPWLNRNILFRILWQTFVLPKTLKGIIDVLFVPGANAVSFSPVVTMCQNLLPFDVSERRLYGFSWMRVRLKLLYYTQMNAFEKAKRVVFLTPSSVHYVSDEKIAIASKAIVIPHGIKKDFYHLPETIEEKGSLKLLYVSIVDVYKHQWNVVEAVQGLLEKGHDIELQCVGSYYKPALQKLNQALMSKPQHADRITYTPLVPYESLKEVYQTADIFVFASSCETFSLILLEAMASGLPIVCSNKDTLRDTLQDAGVYFNPYDSKDIERVLLNLIEDKQLRDDLRKKAYQRAISYSWSKCADLTFSCLVEAGKGV